MKRIKNIEQFEKIINSNKKVVAIFSHPECGPCVGYKKILPDVESKHPDIIFMYVSVDVVPDAANNHKVSCVPTTMLFLSGEPKAKKIGALSASGLSKFISRKLG